MLPLTRAEQQKFDASVVCLRAYTKKNFNVRHHDHQTGCFIDGIRNKCNLALRASKRRVKSKDGKKQEVVFIPCVLYNLKKL